MDANGERRPALYSITEVVKVMGLSKRTLQYYDQIGLLPATERTTGGYRQYDEEAIEILRRISRYKGMGYELKEIRRILESKDYDWEKSLKAKRDDLKKRQDETSEMLENVEEALRQLPERNP